MKFLSAATTTTTIGLLMAANHHVADGQDGNRVKYFMPSEEDEHEGTWLQWPHNNGDYPNQEQRYEQIWIDMTKGLHSGEMVHLVVWDEAQKTSVSSKLQAAGVDMTKVDFYMWPTNDVWVRDNGPIYAFDGNDQLVIQDWGFNGWGEKVTEWLDCDWIPVLIAEEQGTTLVNVSSMINEGGSVEVDGQGTLMAKRSSILNENRNPGMTQVEAEEYFSYYLGTTNFIWLDGIPGLDITDDHIDGTARFGPDNTIITMAKDDLTNPDEYDILQAATNIDGQPYTLVHLPLSDKTIEGGFGGEGSRGVYVNYYVGNTAIIVPNYDDPQDAVANQIIQDLYTNRTVVGVSMVELYKDGGAAHCVTQQQPMGTHSQGPNRDQGGPFTVAGAETEAEAEDSGTASTTDNNNEEAAGDAATSTVEENDSTSSSIIMSRSSTTSVESALDLNKDPSESADDGESTKGLNEATGSLTGANGGIAKPKPSKPAADNDGCQDDSRGPLACLNRKHCFECVCRCDTGVRSSDPDERYGHMVAAAADGVLGDAGEAFCAQNNRVKTLLDDGKVECVHAVAGENGEFIDCQQKWGRCQG